MCSAAFFMGMIYMFTLSQIMIVYHYPKPRRTYMTVSRLDSEAHKYRIFSAS